MVSRVEEIRRMRQKSGLLPQVGERSDSMLEGVPARAPAPAAEDRMRCPICDEDISARAKKCRHCGETLDPSLRVAEEARRTADQQAAQFLVGPGPAVPYTRTKSKLAAFLLAWLLGGIGGHKFYLNRVGQGLLYLVFCWTFIPAVIAFIEGIVYITMDDERFWEKYG